MMPLCPITLGADLKITDRGDVAVIELNGSNAGTQPLRHLHGEQVFRRRREHLEKLRDTLKGQVHWLFFGELPEYREALAASAHTALGDPTNTWNPPYGLGVICNDKGSQRWSIPEASSPPFLVLRGEAEDALRSFLAALRAERWDNIAGNPSLIDLHRHSVVVTKSSWGTVQGEGVWLHHIEDVESILTHVRGTAWKAVVEGFVPSKPLVHPHTRALHDGCLRLHVDYLVDTARKTVETLFECSFWTLCQAPLHSDAHLQEQLNTHTGKCTASRLQPVSTDDHRKAKKSLDTVVRHLMELDPNLFKHLEHEGEADPPVTSPTSYKL